MKLMIDIPEEEYKDLMQTGENTIYLGELLDLRNSVRNGTPLDDVKKEIFKLIDNTDSIYGTSALHSVLDILDNIGKAESEDT